MLQDTSTLPDEMERFDYWFRGIVAVDKETHAHLKATHGRSKVGRPHRYFVIAPDGTFHTNPKGEEQVASYSTVLTLRAFTDREAIEKANQLFPKKFAKFQAALQEIKRLEQVP